MGDLADNQPWQLGPGVAGTQNGGYGEWRLWRQEGSVVGAGRLVCGSGDSPVMWGPMTTELLG